MTWKGRQAVSHSLWVGAEHPTSPLFPPCGMSFKFTKVVKHPVF